LRKSCEAESASASATAAATAAAAASNGQTNDIIVTQQKKSAITAIDKHGCILELGLSGIFFLHSVPLDA